MNKDSWKLAVKALLFFHACRSIDRRKCSSSALYFSSSQMANRSKSLFQSTKMYEQYHMNQDGFCLQTSCSYTCGGFLMDEQISKHQVIYFFRLPGSVHPGCIETIVAFGTPCRLTGHISVPSKYIGEFIGI